MSLLFPSGCNCSCHESMFDNIDGCEYCSDFHDRADHSLKYYSTRDYRKHSASPDVHVPNKQESKLLRKLMSKTGLSEKQLRVHKKYRKMLSDAQKSSMKAKRSRKQKALDRIMKSVTRELKLAKEHPAVQAEFKRRAKIAKLPELL